MITTSSRHHRWHDENVPEVTIVNGQTWALRSDHIAGPSRQSGRSLAVISDSAGAPADDLDAVTDSSRDPATY